MARIWICCSECGSREVTRDALARWDEDLQRWEISGELDNTDCDECGEVDLEEVEIIPEEKIEAELADMGYSTSDEDGFVVLRRGGVQYGVEFEELADAYLWAKVNPLPVEELAKA